MRNWWDLRHRLILERLTADLISANVGVVMEPGPLDPRRDGDMSAPDQLITYQATDRQAGVPRCVTTDVTVHETVTAALIRNRTSVRSKLNNEATGLQLCAAGICVTGKRTLKRSSCSCDRVTHQALAHFVGRI